MKTSDFRDPPNLLMMGVITGYAVGIPLFVIIVVFSLCLGLGFATWKKEIKVAKVLSVSSQFRALRLRGTETSRH